MANVINYDLVGRLTNRVEITGGITRTLGYTYDAGGRLAAVWQNGVIAAAYTYDANGNRTSRNGETATYDAQDRVMTYGTASFGWSRQGDLKTRSASGQTTQYTYDLRGGLAAVILPDGQQIEYLRDALGHCIGRKLNGTLQRGWLRNGGQIAAEVDNNSVVTSQFIYAADGTAPSLVIKGNKTYRIISDERGSVRLVVDTANGTIAQQLDYDEFGRVLTDTAPGFQPFGFAAGLYDADTGLIRFGTRDYSPESGQWIERDPVDFDGGQLSLYAYVGNDPINAVDPSGTGPITVNTRPEVESYSGTSTTLPYDLPPDPYGYAAGGKKVGLATAGGIAGAAMVFGGAELVAAGVTANWAAGQIAGGLFLAGNGVVGVIGNTGNALNTIAATGAPDAPTSIPQIIFPQKVAAVIDIVLGRTVPANLTGVTANVAKAAGIVDDANNAETAIDAKTVLKGR